MMWEFSYTRVPHPSGALHATEGGDVGMKLITTPRVPYPSVALYATERGDFQVLTLGGVRVPYFSRVLCARKPVLSLSKGGDFPWGLPQ